MKAAPLERPRAILRGQPSRGEAVRGVGLEGRRSWVAPGTGQDGLGAPVP